MIEVFDEKLVDECLSEVADSDIKTYAYCLLDWAVRKRKVQAVPLDRIKQAREEIQGELFIKAETRYMNGFNDAINICLRNLDRLISESEG